MYYVITGNLGYFNFCYKQCLIDIFITKFCAPPGFFPFAKFLEEAWLEKSMKGPLRVLGVCRFQGGSHSLSCQPKCQSAHPPMMTLGIIIIFLFILLFVRQRLNVLMCP